MGPEPSERAPAPRGRGPATAFLVALLVLAGLTAVAVADPASDALLRPPEYGSPLETADLGEASGQDVEPLGRNAEKDGGKFWKVVAGARFGEKEVDREGSPAPFEMDFYDVSFRDETSGMAVGAECRDPVDPGASDFESEVNGCERVPVIYRYTDIDGWKRAYRSEDAGYAGGIAFIDNRRALIVGGTGTFPRREPNGVGEEWTYENRVERDREQGAGLARVWLWEDGAVRELADLPAGMRGLNAVDFWIGSGEPGKQTIGAAGGFGQIWLWRNDRFDERFDRDVAAPYARDARLFDSRVREIRFAPDPHHPHLFAVTAGCCGQRPTDGSPGAEAGGSRRIEHLEIWEQNATPTGPPPLPYMYGDPRGPSEPRWMVSGADGDSVFSFGMRWAQVAMGSYQGLAWAFSGLVKARAGAAPSGESAFRFVQGDGDAEVRPGGQGYPKPPPGDGTLDWRVGEWRSADAGLGGRALVETTRQVRPWVNEAVQPDCPSTPQSQGTNDEVWTSDSTNNIRPGICRVDQVSGGELPSFDEAKFRESVQSRTWSLDAYRLNAVEVMDEAGDGWAVGDRGAIARLSSTASGEGAEPDPASVGERQAGRLPDRSAYPSASVATEAGTVPPLVTRPERKGERPAFVSAGSPDPTDAVATRPIEAPATIVMSRDGDEGWALGGLQSLWYQSTAQLSLALYHYENGQWSRCEPHGIPTLEEPDRECAGLAPLMRVANFAYVSFSAAARVPLENDDDPDNDDDFEVLAAGTRWAGAGESGGPWPIIARYREGEWSIESLETRSSLSNSNTDFPKSLALSAPDEGWLLSQQNRLYRFDGRRFTDCWTAKTAGELVNAEACGDPDGHLARIAMGRNAATVIAAGESVFLGGTVGRHDPGATARRGTPLVLQKERGAADWRASLDPGPAGEAGSVSGLSISETPDGRHEGWAFGYFGGLSGGHTDGIPGASTVQAELELDGYFAMRLDPDGRWRPFARRDAAGDYLNPSGAERLNDLYDGTGQVRSQLAVSYPGTDGEPGRAYVSRHGFPGLLGFEPGRGRFEVVESDRMKLALESPKSRVAAVAPDGEGGAWVAMAVATEASRGLTPFGGNSDYDTYFYRLTPRAREPVFEESPHPAGSVEPTAIAGAADGSVWMGTRSDRLYRYDRVTGWDRVRVPGWQRGRIVTRPAEVNDVAVNADGAGVAVGESGRIANLGPDGATLDPAAGASCDPDGARAPCGTGRHLRAAAVAPDGAALVGGDAVTALWRPAGGELRQVASPPASKEARIVAASLPSAERGWVVTSNGRLFGGEAAGGGWRWRREAVDSDGRALSRALTRHPETGIPEPGPLLDIRDIAIRADGSGYAVGEQGLVLERTAAGEWRRLDIGRRDDLTSVALPAGGGKGALVGGKNGLLLTLVNGRFEVARHADALAAPRGQVTGLALMPGAESGHVEAWALEITQDPFFVQEGSSRLLHYGSEAGGSLLDPGRGLRASADSPSARPGEIGFAAFGRSDCANDMRTLGCREIFGGSEPQDVILRRVRDEIAARGRRTPGGLFALHTGDAYDSGGPTGRTPMEALPAGKAVTGAKELATVDWQRPGRVKFRRMDEMIFSPLAQAGVGALGAIGGRDLSETRNCDSSWSGAACPQPNPRDYGITEGENLAWRDGMAERPGGWGTSEAFEAGGYRFEPVASRAGTVEPGEVSTSGAVPPAGAKAPGASTPGVDTPGLTTPTGQTVPAQRVGPQRVEESEVSTKRLPPVTLRRGARTHYATDIMRGDTRVARVVVVDTSMRSLTASDAQQNPGEEQLEWLESVLCVRGSGSVRAGCSRERGQPAIVVSNTPTYSYGPGAGSDTQTDGSVFESVLMRHDASVVVSGRIGWNGRYWATAPGVHEPCPGGAYVPDQQAPRPGARRVCGEAVEPRPAEDVQKRLGEGAASLAAALDGAGAPAPPEAEALKAAAGASGLEAILPFVVASSAGGMFGPDGSAAGPSREGFWRGYTVVRLDPAAGPAATVVEQRPVFDWVRIEAQSHVMRPGQRMNLRGEGREPLGTAWLDGQFRQIDSPAITHRYDLWEADGEEPWMPRKDADGRYVPLPPDVATIDRDSGRVAAGRGNHPRVYAVATLSVGCSGAEAGEDGHCDPGAEGVHTASFPIAFEPRKSFRPEPPARVAALPLPRPAPAIRTLAAQPSIPPQPPASAPPPVSASPTFPPTPALPAAPPPLSGATPQPPAPPALPPPPPPQLPTALDLLASPPSVPLAPQATVIPPPAPPIQPAPPGGARREARQRQAAVQKGEEGGGEGSGEAQELGGDGANAPPTNANAMTRARGAEQHPFTARRSSDQPSAWARTALYGGGTGLMALVLALGWTATRPGPRRRPPHVPAAAWARHTRR